MTVYIWLPSLTLQENAVDNFAGNMEKKSCKSVENDHALFSTCVDRCNKTVSGFAFKDFSIASVDLFRADLDRQTNRVCPSSHC